MNTLVGDSLRYRASLVPCPPEAGVTLLGCALELNGGVVGGELVLHRAGGTEGGADAQNVAVVEALGRAGAAAADGGAERAEQTEAHGLTTLQVADNLLLHGGDDGADVVRGDGTLLADFLSESFELNDGDGSCHGVEHGLFGARVLALLELVLDHDNQGIKG